MVDSNYSNPYVPVPGKPAMAGTPQGMARQTEAKRRMARTGGGSSGDQIRARLEVEQSSAAEMPGGVMRPIQKKSLFTTRDYSTK